MEKVVQVWDDSGVVVYWRIVDMAKELFEQYIEISKKIDQETDAYMGQLFSMLMEESEHLEKNSWIAHETAMVAMRCYRISLLCQLLNNGYDNQEKLRQDIEALLTSIESLEYSGRIDDKIVSDTMDCLSCLWVTDECRNIVMEHLPEQYRQYELEHTDISAELYYLITDIAEYYFEHISNTLGVRTLSALVALSRHRNGELSIKHRELVVKVLARLGDNYPEDSYSICTVEQNSFKNTKDEYVGDFLWFYGCILQKLGKMETAGNVFRACYEVRLCIYGENDWYTILARREYAVISLFSADDENSDEVKFLRQFINTIEEGGYSDIQQEMLEIIEGKTLYSLLQYGLNKNDISSFWHYLNIFEGICKRYNSTAEPLLKLRLSRNLYGGYCFKNCNYIQAEQAFKEALVEQLPDDTVEIISEAQIKSNLLMVYYVENDMEHAIPLVIELLDLIDEKLSGLSPKDEYRIYTLYCGLVMQSLIDYDEDEATELRDILNELQDEIFENNILSSDYASELSVFIIIAVQLLVQNNYATPSDCNNYLKVLRQIRDDAGKVHMDQGQKAVLYLVMAMLAWELQEKSAEDYIITSVKHTEGAAVPMTTKAAVLQTAATILSKTGKENVALHYLNQSLNQITNIWQSYMRYSNDSRLLQILSPTQLVFSCCYAIMRKQSNVSVVYEKVLQYKALASLTGKERNRVQNSGYIDQGLVTRIKMVQDRISVMESENIFRGVSKEYKSEKERLRELEAQFAQRFPENINLTEITYKNLENIVPDNSVVVEYFLCADDYGERLNEQTSSEETDILVFDVFIIRKENGQCSLQKITIQNAEEILDMVQEFVEILQAESCQSANVHQVERKEQLRLALYCCLIEPIKQYIAGIRRLYMAPDSNIMNLPFEILSGEDGDYFGDMCNIIKMECARDFLFSDPDEIGGVGSFIVGNPQYELRERYVDIENQRDGQERTRFTSLKVENIYQLPFSELEVQLVSKYCNTAFNVGKSATKQLFLASGSCKNIHLATHGFYDLSEETDAIYSSCLLFAGVKNWLQTGNENAEYGNGIVTADEISRLNFEDVELVVLSSCLGAMNETVLSRGFQGLIGGLSAAGVKYVISNLWAADDFATAVLMDAFYYQYKTKGMEPPVALRMAKQYLRKVTVGDLKKRKWFDYILHSKCIDAETRKMVERYASRNENYRPFKSEIYWAGFTCFRCN